jgi:predicted ATPase/class 3 adenylate cyclase
VTFLFSDIEGSTALWELHPGAMPTALARHDALLRQAIECHGGHLFKTVGDAVYAAFASAKGGLAAALDVQHALQRESWGALGTLHVRMALHTGVVEAHASDYLGPPLNRVAQLLAAGHGGQILLSRATVELVRDALPPDVTLRNLGERRLKDLSRPEHIFQVVMPSLPADFPPLRTLDARPNNLPAQPNTLIGREREVSVVRDLLRRAGVRLVTLTGPGGTGKTRLALQVASELLDEFTHGVWFVNLAPISDSALVISTIAQTLGVKESGSQSLVDMLKTYLHTKQMLLLLDNFEQVINAAVAVAELLIAAPGLKVLVTSRALLHLSGEHEFTVPPLALPERQPLMDLARLTQYEAVRLFIERAQAVRADFAVTNENAPAVAEICHRLDGLPLAIELAAARVKLFPPMALLARLSSRLAILTGGPADLPARQQTLRNTIDWSYQLLDAGEKALFARLGVFVGGWNLAAAEAVCTIDGDRPLEVLDGIASLLDKSLLRQPEGVDVEPRFTMLETIREYALERLAASGEGEAIRQRHALFFTNLAEEIEPNLVNADRGRWLQQLDPELDNVRTALAWSRTEIGRGELGIRLAGALGWFWYFRGHLSEGYAWLDGALAQTEALGRTMARAKALTAAARLAYYQNDRDPAASTLAAEGVALWRELRDDRGLAYALIVLGLTHLDQDDTATACVLLDESVALFRALGDKSGCAHSLVYRGVISTHTPGNQAVARPFLEESEAIYRELGDQWGLGGTLYNLALVSRRQGDITAARRLVEESLTLFRSAEDFWRASVALNQLGILARDAGDDRLATAYFTESLALNRQVGDQKGVAWQLQGLAVVALHQGDCTRAATRFTESLALFQKLKNNNGIAICLVGFAGVSQTQGQPERAARLLGAAEAMFDAAGTVQDGTERADCNRYVAATRAQLNEETFTAMWEAGRAMTIEQAIESALGDH